MALTNYAGTTVDHVCPLDGHRDNGIAVPGGVTQAAGQVAFSLTCTSCGAVEFFNVKLPPVDPAATDIHDEQTDIIRAIQAQLGWTLALAAGHAP